MRREKDHDYYDEIYASSVGYRCHYKESVYYVMWTQAIRFIRHVSSPKILEIGCGTGQFAHYLYDEGYKDYHGFDFSPEAIRIARKTVHQSFDIGDALDSRSYVHDYNVVIAQEILEHIEDDLAVLNNIKNGSYIIFSLPTFDDPAHVRWFINAREIEKRYYRYIDIKEIVPVDAWFICRGIVDEFHPKFLNRLFQTREQVNVKLIFHRIIRVLPPRIYRSLKAFTTSR